MSRDYDEDREKIAELNEEYLDELKLNPKRFIEDISERDIDLTEAQGEWLDSLWEQYLKF